MNSHLTLVLRNRFRSGKGALNSLYVTNASALIGRKDDKASTAVGHQQKNEHKIQMRHYHGTKKKEILPLIALGVGITGYYSIRALRRMDQDWEDYQESLREYNLEHGIVDDDNFDGAAPNPSTMSASASPASAFKGGTMAMDLGTKSIRIAYKPYSGKQGQTKANIVANREGARATPNYILYDSDGSFVTGNLAAAKLYERSKSNSPVVNPGILLRNSQNDEDESIRNTMVQKVISSCAKDALEQVLGKNNSASSTSKSLFSIDTGMGGYNVQPVFTYPPSYVSANNNSLNAFKDAVGSLSFPDSIASFVPEPVAAVTAAKELGLLKNSSQGPVMVVDIGASTTSISLVDMSNDEIHHNSTLSGFGGETLVHALMTYMSKSFYGRKFEDVNDQMGVQRLHDAALGAIMELSSGSKNKHGRVQVNIPYLSVDEKMQPKHLNMGVSASVLEAEFNDLVAKDVVPKFVDKQDVLSRSMQNPSDLTLLFSSMIMRVFEESNQNPFSLNSLLVVGGGARSPIIQKAIKQACATLAGEQFVQDKVIVPKDELVEELVVLGAGTAAAL